VEKSPFATSYIPTTTAAVTRSAETCTVTGLGNIGRTADDKTILCDFKYIAGGVHPKIHRQLFHVEGLSYNMARVNSGTSGLIAHYGAAPPNLKSDELSGAGTSYVLHSRGRSS